MVFDGQVARMQGARSPSWSRPIGYGDRLAFRRQGPADAGGTRTSHPRRSRIAQAASIATIRLRDAVDLKSAQTDLDGNRRQLDHLEVPELAILVPRQQWVGTGPGSLRSRRIANGNPASPQEIQTNQVSTSVFAASASTAGRIAMSPSAIPRQHGGDMQQQLITFEIASKHSCSPFFLGPNPRRFAYRSIEVWGKPR